MRENVIYGENVTYDESVNRRQLAWHTATQARPDLHPGDAVQIDVIYARTSPMRCALAQGLSDQNGQAGLRIQRATGRRKPGRNQTIWLGNATPRSPQVVAATVVGPM